MPPLITQTDEECPKISLEKYLTIVDYQRGKEVLITKLIGFKLFPKS